MDDKKEASSICYYNSTMEKTAVDSLTETTEGVSTNLDSSLTTNTNNNSTANESSDLKGKYSNLSTVINMNENKLQSFSLNITEESDSKQETVVEEKPETNVVYAPSPMVFQKATKPKPVKTSKIANNLATLFKNKLYTSNNHNKNKLSDMPVYSTKLFLGGLPWDITEKGLYECFKTYGPCYFEWPGKESSIQLTTKSKTPHHQQHTNNNVQNRHPNKGYVYLIYENEKSVKNLLKYCTFSNEADEYYYTLKQVTGNDRKVQVIPWLLSSSSFIRTTVDRLDKTKTVFVGGLHGKINAKTLAVVFENLFGHVVFAGIDTDKHKYPIGSGRVTFDNELSYRYAINSSFVEIDGKRFSKRVQIDPYLEECNCSCCLNKAGPYFCKNENCLRYFCFECWIEWHDEAGGGLLHKPLTRQNGPSCIELYRELQKRKQKLGRSE